MTTEHDVIWLTQEAYDKLQGELENLRGPERDEIVARIAAARDEGDLKENGGYHAAREEQGKTEARIRQLEDMLRRAAGRRDARRRRRRRARHGRDRPLRRRHRHREVPPRRPRDGRPDSDLQVYSPQSPMGSALVGAEKGDDGRVRGAERQELKVEIVDAVPFVG